MPVRTDGDLLSWGCYLLAPLTGNKEGTNWVMAFDNSVPYQRAWVDITLAFHAMCGMPVGRIWKRVIRVLVGMTTRRECSKAAQVSDHFAFGLLSLRTKPSCNYTSEIDSLTQTIAALSCKALCVVFTSLVKSLIQTTTLRVGGLMM